MVIKTIVIMNTFLSYSTACAQQLFLLCHDAWTVNMKIHAGLLLTYHYLIKATKLQCLEPVDEGTMSSIDANLWCKQLLILLYFVNWLYMYFLSQTPGVATAQVNNKESYVVDVICTILISLRNALFCPLCLICDCLFCSYLRHWGVDGRMNLCICLWWQTCR